MPRLKKTRGRVPTPPPPLPGNLCVTVFQSTIPDTYPGLLNFSSLRCKVLNQVALIPHLYLRTIKNFWILRLRLRGERTLVIHFYIYREFHYGWAQALERKGARSLPTERTYRFAESVVPIPRIAIAKSLLSTDLSVEKQESIKLTWGFIVNNKKLGE